MVGFPHSEILGSKLIRSSPRLIAAYYVLHRLHAPRHPLDALKTLDRSHYLCPQHTFSLLFEKAVRTRTKFTTPSRRSPPRRRQRGDHIRNNVIVHQIPEDLMVLIGQIKKPKFTCSAVSPRGTGQTSSKTSLYNVERSGTASTQRRN
jgi:hypothetical protein